MSSKYDVKYEKGRFEKIDKKEKYYSLFPENIVSTTAIVGKNNSGKTNLLNFIGLPWEYFEEEEGEGFLLYSDEESDSFQFKLLILGESLLHDIKSNFEKEPVKEDDTINYQRGKKCFPLFIKTSGDNNFELVFEPLHNTKKSNILYLGEENESKYSVHPPGMINKMQSKIPEATTLSKFNIITYYFNMLEEGTEKHPYLDKEYELSIKFAVQQLKEGPLHKDHNEIVNKIEQIRDSNMKIKCHFMYSFLKDMEESSLNKTRNETRSKRANYQAYELLNEWLDKSINQEKFLENIRLEYKDYDFRAIFERLEEIYSKMQALNKNDNYQLILEIISKKRANDEKSEGIRKILELIFEDKLDKIDQSCIKSFVQTEIKYDMGSGAERFLSIAYVISGTIDQIVQENTPKYINECTVLIDEPEKGFHPELSRTFLSDLFELLIYFHKGIQLQFIISTHSPFIISDLYSSAVIKMEEGKVVSEESERQFFAANIHELLADEFFMTSTKGELARKKINEIIDWINNDEIDEKAGEWDAKIQEYEFIIEQIADSLLRKTLKRRIFEKILINPKSGNRVEEVLASFNEDEKEELLSLLQEREHSR